jgi:hypothetical protein
LLADIERIQLYGEDVPGSDLILAELRAEFRRDGESHSRAGNPSRHFFKPIEDLFVDRPSERTNSGEISRGSLSAIWQWINQFLLPTMARDYCEKMTELIVRNNPREIALLAGGFQSKVVKSLEGFLSSDEQIEAARLGLGKYTSSRASYDDLTKVMSALRVRDAIVAFSDALPAKLNPFEGEPVARLRGQLKAFAAKHPGALPFALTIVAKRLKPQWQLVRLATDIARGKSAADIAATPYGMTVGMVLDRLDDKRMALNQALKSNRVAIAKELLAEIYDIEHALRSRITGLDKSDWGQRLDELMAAVAAGLAAEIKSLPESTRHVLASSSLHRHHEAWGRLASLIDKGRGLIGFRQNSAG